MPCVRGLAPETRVDLLGYSVTIKLCDSYCLGIGLGELRRSATIKLRDDSGWRSLYTLSSGVSVDDNEVDGVGDNAGGVGVIPGPQWTTAFGSIYPDR
ncbi:uncharacterized protein UHOD_12205 [Ustilago sp. UG-2017b]|nr:uncharacterized protein UHOD_12205 [Ustilago sp. UG-2017b]